MPRQDRSLLLVALTSALTLAACGSSAPAPGASPVPGAPPTPVAMPTPAGTPLATPTPAPTPSPVPTLVASRSVLASEIRGSGDVSVAASPDGFLAAWIVGDESEPVRIVARRLDARGEPLDAEPITVATGSDIELGIPSDSPPSFDSLVVGFDAADHVVTWSSDRLIYGWPSESASFARRVRRDGSVAPELQVLFYELSAGFCNAATSGPLAAATADAGMLLFSVRAAGCFNVPPFAVPSISILGPTATPEDAVAIDDDVGVSGQELVLTMLGSTGSAAARGPDALVRWLGTIPTRDQPSRNGLWVEGTRARAIPLGGTIDVASDGRGYLVLASEAPSGAEPRELRAATFDPATLLVDAGGAVLARGDFGRTALAAFGPDAYVAAHQSDGALDAPLFLTAVTLADGTLATADVVALSGGELLDLRAASGTRAAVLLASRRDGDGSFVVESVAVGMR